MVCPFFSRLTVCDTEFQLFLTKQEREKKDRRGWWEEPGGCIFHSNSSDLFPLSSYKHHVEQNPSSVLRQFLKAGG